MKKHSSHQSRSLLYLKTWKPHTLDLYIIYYTMSSLSAATASIHAALSSLQNDNSGMSESDRSAALDACDRLRAKLIGPIDVVFDITLVVSQVIYFYNHTII